MIRWLLLAGFVAAFPVLADKLVDRQFRRMPAHENTGYTPEQVDAVNRLAAEAVVTFKMPPAKDCGLDWLCLVAEAEKQHPRKGKKP